ncbi:hypothetical protein BDV98DRAFT_410776 [Pterulicium gracile]|uniref:Uncharacterized protein n=1 Tax=Pterulicium gracile TaxID=1884261 RepID=A0A5C3QLS8_9AGAR|nr:hypothetical protein BDV98DRAFT_410776 [Pterula gracilis]
MELTALRLAGKCRPLSDPKQLECLRHLLTMRLSYARPMPLSVFLDSFDAADAIIHMAIEVLVPEHRTWEDFVWTGANPSGLSALLANSGKPLDFPKLKGVSLKFRETKGTKGDDSALLSCCRRAPLLECTRTGPTTEAQHKGFDKPFLWPDSHPTPH